MGRCRVDRPGIDDGVGGEAQQVDGLTAQRPVLVQSGEQEHVVDEQAHAFRFGLDPSQDPCYVLRLADSAEFVHGGVPADGGQWGAKFVAGVGDEAT